MNSLGLLAFLLAAPNDDAFEKNVRPVLVESCVKCHGPDKASGGLRVDSRAALLKGGESGPAIVPGKPGESRLMLAVRRGKGIEPMPPDKPLPAAAIKALDDWIAAGAPWPASVAPISVAKHWAFQPVVDRGTPHGEAKHPIDRFLAAKSNSVVDARTLVRRMTFDLTGLPPNPADVEAFVRDAEVHRERAIERLIDRLLASPGYGEKWGRRWLDVVRYADTAGETADYPVPEAWRYRNYVFDAFNKDVPYDRFLREQLAGDILAARLPNDAPPERYAELVTATGYLAVARRFGFDVLKDHFLTIEDTIDTVGKSVLGLTIACARCHDHKYDPISANDYYALYGIFESTRYPHPGSEKNKTQSDFVPLRAGGDERRKLDEAKARVAASATRAADADGAIRKAELATTELASGEFANGGKQDFVAGKGAERLKSIAVRKGEMIRLCVLPKANHGADSTLVDWRIAEVGGSNRVWDATRDLVPDFYDNGAGAHHSDSFGNKSVWHLFDLNPIPRAFTTYERNVHKVPGLFAWYTAGIPSASVNANDKSIKYITITQPAKSFCVHPGPAGGMAVGWQSPIDGTVTIAGRVEDLDSSGGDGIAWSIRKGPGIGNELGAAAESELARREVERIERNQPRAYAVWEGAPHDAQLHKRGDPDTRGPAVPRRFLTVLGGQPLPNGSGSGRLELAGWLTDPKNPLTARVMVNRIWQGHFGKGLIETPNDFGTRGLPPTNPALLDWLTARFIESGWSMKQLHRLILTSAAYQRPAGQGFERRRLEAEEVRDALLAVSGDLDSSPAGAHPFPDPKTWGFTQHVPFTAVYETNRRSAYLMTQRIKRHPFLALFDGPDPNASTPARGTSTVATQALYFLNDPFVHARAESLARRLTGSTDERLERAFGILYGRAPSTIDREVAREFFATGGTWPGWLRVMFGSNEFVYVD